MLPTLRPGDLLLIAATSPSAQPDDLVLVAWTERPIAVKRLLQIEPDGAWWVVRDSPSVGIDSFSHGAVPVPGQRGVVLGRLWPRPRPLRSFRRR